MDVITGATSYLTEFGLVGGLLLVLIGGYRGWWVFGNYHREIVTEIRKDRDEWKAIALQGVKVAAKATNLTTQTQSQDGA